MHRLRVVPLVAALALCTALGQPEQADPRAVAVHDVTVVDVVSGGLRPHATVIVEGSRITAVAPAAGALPKGAQVIDGRGRFLIPGLWDMHSHALWSPEALKHPELRPLARRSPCVSGSRRCVISVGGCDHERRG